MIALIQRVIRASVSIDGDETACIGFGVLVLVGVEKMDESSHAERLSKRLLGFRLFNDHAGRMNLDVREVGGGVLLVPQFTLAADTRSGRRPGFSTAATPESGRLLFDEFCVEVRKSIPDAVTSTFGANMQVSLVNDGPVTFWLQSGGSRQDERKT
ncbi:MAG: D-aminoacyl-tRNA deacylase [Granulosicoccus sp.]